MSPPPQEKDPYLAWRFSSYRRFVSARAIFSTGAQMQTTAVGWQLYERFGSKMALAYVGLVQIIPILLLSLPAGHVADRHSRIAIIMRAQGLFLLASLGLAALSYSGRAPEFIYLMLFVAAIARSFTQPALVALLPTVIPRETWANAMTWNSSVFELSSMIGPAVAGLLIAATGGATCVYVVTAGCALACLLLIAPVRPILAQVIPPRGSATWADVVGGLRFVLRTRLIVAAMSLDLFAVLLGGATALLPVVAKDILHVGPEGFGWLRAAPSVGAMSMALLTAHLRPWNHSGRVLCGAVMGFGLAMIVFGLSENFWLSFAMLVCGGVCDNINVVIRQTLVQFITPDVMRGRVSSVSFIFIGCSNELGGLESGTTAQLFGTVPSIVGGGFGTMLVVLAIIRLFPSLWRMGRLQDVPIAPVSATEKAA